MCSFSLVCIFSIGIAHPPCAVITRTLSYHPKRKVTDPFSSASPGWGSSFVGVLGVGFHIQPFLGRIICGDLADGFFDGDAWSRLNWQKRARTMDLMPERRSRTMMSERTEVSQRPLTGPSWSAHTTRTWSPGSQDTAKSTTEHPKQRHHS